jgi:transposase
MGNQLEGLVIVCDNAPCHSRLEAVTNGTTVTLLRLGPYSPMLNPIEAIWSKVKCYTKTHLRVPQVVAPGVIE